MISYYCWDFSTTQHNKMAETICSMLWLFQPFHLAPQSTIRGAFQWRQNWFPLFQLTSSWKIATFLCSFSSWSDIIRQIREKHQKVLIYTMQMNIHVTNIFIETENCTIFSYVLKKLFLNLEIKVMECTIKQVS